MAREIGRVCHDQIAILDEKVTDLDKALLAPAIQGEVTARLQTKLAITRSACIVFH